MGSLVLGKAVRRESRKPQSLSTKRFACASEREKGHGDEECCPPSDRTADGLDSPRHLRSGRSPSADSLLPSAGLNARFPQQRWVGPLAGEISIHQTFLRSASDTSPESYRAWPLLPLPPRPFVPAGERSRPMWLFLLVRVTADPSPGLSGCGSPPPDTRSVTEVLG